MAHWRKVDTRIHGDRKYRALSDGSKFLFLSLLTHPNLTTVGAMRASTASLAADMRWSHNGTRRALGELSRAGLVKIDDEACCMVLPGWVKHNPPESENNVKAWRGALSLVPECELRDELIDVLRCHTESRGESFLKAFESLGLAPGSEGVMDPLLDPLLDPLVEQGEVEVEGEVEGRVLSANATSTQASSANATEALSATEPPTCPHKQIIDLYREVLPELPGVQSWGEERRRYLRARWREDPGRQTLDWWRGYFEKVRSSSFLMGRANGSGGRAWRCNLEWLVRPTNFAKVLDGIYDDLEQGDQDDEMEVLPPPNPHEKSLHGMIDVTGTRRWCSRQGGWISQEQWTPLTEGSSVD